MTGSEKPSAWPVSMGLASWWGGVLLVSMSLLAFGACPRYQVQVVPASGQAVIPPFVVRVDQWTGRVEVVPPYYLEGIEDQIQLGAVPEGLTVQPFRERPDR